MDWGVVLDKILPLLISGGAVYAAIRSDLREAHVLAKLALSNSDKAHERIDSILGLKK